MLKTALEQESEKLSACVHCGLCLPVCPTYQQLGNENDSPRGRLYLMRAVAENKLTVSDKYHKHLDLCLGCRACETVCPSGVQFGHLLEMARADMVEQPPANLTSQTRTRNRLTRLILTQVFAYPLRLKVVCWLATLVQRSHLANIMLKIGLPEWLASLRLPLALLTQAQSQQKQARKLLNLGNKSPLPPPPPTQTVTQFLGCVMEGLFTETNRATTRVLETNGCKVTMPPQQRCCGALHAHSGLHQEALALAKANIDAFSVPDNAQQPIIVNSAGCGAMMKQYATLLANDPEYAPRAQAFSKRVQDISEFLATQPLKLGHTLKLRVTYDAPCHLYHGQAVREQPIDLIKQIPGVEFVPLLGAETCCGSAGIYNIAHPEMAQKILADKLAKIKQTGAQLIVTGNPGCAMHIGAALYLDNQLVILLHPVELIDLSYQG